MKNKFKKICGLLLSVCIISIGCIGQTYGASLPEYVRVGLEYKYKDVNSVNIDNKEIFFGTDINGVFGDFGSFTSSSGFNVSISNRYYVGLSTEFTNYSDTMSALNEYKTLGYNAIPAHIGKNKWSIYISAIDYSDASTITSKINNSVIANPNKIIELKDGSSVVALADGIYPQITAIDNSGIVKLGDRSYRGAIEFGKYTNNLMTAVNVIDLEEYLYGVIPSEMPSSYGTEALKAQAVAARSYTLTRIGVHKESGYELCDSINCQVYKGYSGEVASTNSAVDATKGIMAYHDSKPINAVFFASSGGYTENSENVWTYSVPYLKSVTDKNEIDTNVWSRTFSISDINSLLSSNGANIGSAIDMVITKDNTSGRVQELKILGTSGNKILSKEEIRTFFAPKGGALNSRLFNISTIDAGGNTFIPTPPPNENTIHPNVSIIGSTVFVQGIGNVRLVVGNDNYVVGSDSNTYIVNSNGGITVQGLNNTTETSTNTKETNKNVSEKTFVISGTGNGHGVGLSQKGANGMAKAGSNYVEILKHYYTGIEVR